MADQLTLFQQGAADFAHSLLAAPPKYMIFKLAGPLRDMGIIRKMGPLALSEEFFLDDAGPSQGLKIRGARSTGWGECAPPLVEIELTDLPKTGGA